MQVERSFITTHDPEVLATKSKKELFRDAKDAHHNRVRLDIVTYLDAYLRSCGNTLTAEKGEEADPDKQLVIALNHHSRQKYFTTEESLRTVSIATVGAHRTGLHDGHTAWMIRELQVPPVGIGKMAREVQNATEGAFGSIVSRTKRVVKWRGIIPTLKENMTNIEEVQRKIAENVQAKNAIAIFPEQEPTFKLKPNHRNFPRIVNGLKLIAGDYQIATASVFYEGSNARVNFGPIVQVDRSSDTEQVVEQVMNGIASGLPRNLRGAYAKSLQSQ